uniref:Uncharacterized protein n=1 Tax=Rheinheimera sp. BAL341 TaxID=1708203 RepID=A0A486XSH4_9GAMM
MCNTSKQRRHGLLSAVKAAKVCSKQQVRPERVMWHTKNYYNHWIWGSPS